MASAKALPPGGVGEIETSLKTKGAQGTLTKSVTVETNDPANPRVRLKLVTKVVNDVTVDPRYVNFGNVNRNEPPAPRRLTVSFRAGEKIRIEKVRSESESVVVEKAADLPDGAVYTVGLAEKLVSGRVTGKIVLETTSDKNPRVEVPFHAFVHGDVRLSPQLLSFGLVRPGQNATRRLTLQSTGQTPFTVTKIKSTVEALTTELVPEKEGERYRLSVTYDPGEKTRGRISERLTIFVESGGEEEIIEVPIYGTIHQQTRPNAPSAAR